MIRIIDVAMPIVKIRRGKYSRRFKLIAPRIEKDVKNIIGIIIDTSSADFDCVIFIIRGIWAQALINIAIRINSPRVS
jgi:hypothetical protein